MGADPLASPGLRLLSFMSWPDPPRFPRPGANLMLMDPQSDRPVTSSVAPRLGRAAPGRDGRRVWLLHPPGSDGHALNTEALVAWHEAHREPVTLVVERGRWTGGAAVDEGLVLGGSAPWDLEDLRMAARGRVAAIDFPRPASIGLIIPDRDGTIIEDRDYLADPRGVTLLPGAAGGLRQLAARGVRLAILTNQSGVASGRITPAQLDAVHARLQAVLAAEGIALDGVYACIHAVDAGCDCRKPAVGLALRAAQELGLRLTEAVGVGDKAADVLLAHRLRVPAFLVRTGHGESTFADGTAQADYLIDGLDQLARICCHPAGLAVEAPVPTA